jgi:hypothetical protein
MKTTTFAALITHTLPLFAVRVRFIEHGKNPSNIFYTFQHKTLLSVSIMLPGDNADHCITYLAEKL